MYQPKFTITNDTLIKFSKKTLILSLVFFLLVSAIINSYFYPGEKNIEKKINEVLPSGAFLRDFEPIPNLTPTSYLVLYVKNPKFDEIPKERDQLYTTCPELTRGQAIEGEYHLALFQKNSFTSDIVIPPSRQKLVFKNTKYNIYSAFNGSKPEKEEEFELEKVKLIHFQDYTGDNQPYEFRLIGETFACGYTSYLIAGYNPKKGEVTLYPIKEKGKTYYWSIRFSPNSSGRAEVIISCGDHGSDVEERKIYQFNPDEEAYFLIEEKVIPCTNQNLP